jgi:hypothetical protein
LASLGDSDIPEDQTNGVAAETTAGMESVAQASHISDSDDEASEAGRPRLPNANEFSPGQVDLRDLLSIARRHPGDPEAMIADILLAYPKIGQSAPPAQTPRSAKSSAERVPTTSSSGCASTAYSTAQRTLSPLSVSLSSLLHRC